MNKLKKTSWIMLVILMVIFTNLDLLAQGEITITELTGGVSTSPLVQGATNQAILGVQVDKAAGATSSITQIVIALDENPTGKFINARLCRSDDNVFDAADLSNVVATGILNASDITFTGSPISGFSVSGVPQASAQTRYFFIVIDVDPTVTSAANPITPSVAANTNITASTTVNAGTITGDGYSFDEATNTITQISGGIAGSPLDAGASDQALLGFSISSNGSPYFTAINVQITNSTSGKLSNIRLFSSTDNSFDVTDTDLTATAIANATEIQFSGFSESLSSSNKNFFVVADIDNAANASTPPIKLSFTESNVSYSYGTTPSITIEGTDYTFEDVTAPTITYNPAGGSTGVSVKGNLIITLNEPVRNIDDSPISASDLNTLVELKLTNDGGSSVAFTASIDGTNQIITINPTTDLSGSQLYFLEINSIEDFSNNAATGNITFTTEPPPSITAFAGPTCVGESITISGNDFGMSQPTVSINGNIATVTSHSNTSITFTVPNTGSGAIQVENNDNDLSTTSGTTTTINPGINTGLTVTPSTNNPAQGTSVNIFVASPQSGVTYELFLVSYAGSGTVIIGSKGSDNSSPVVLNTSNLTETGTYNYKITASRAGCSTVDLATTVTLTVAELSASAGTDKTICQGQSVVIGDSPTAQGGSGFHSIIWSGPSGFSSTNPNPSVTVAGTYSVIVEDNLGSSDNDDVVVTVESLPTVSFVPSGTDLAVRTQFNNQEDPYELAASAAPNNGSGVFSGLGVSLFPNGKYYFSPAVAGTASNPITITYTHTNTSTCANTTTLQVNVFNSNVIVNNLDPSYCTQDGLSDILTHNPLVIPPSFTYTRMRLFKSGEGYLDVSDPTNYPNIFIEQGTSKTYRFNPNLAGTGFYYVVVFGTRAGIESLITYGTTIVYANPSAPIYKPIPPYCVSDDIAMEIVSLKASGTVTWYNNSAPSSPITVVDSYNPTFDELGLNENFSGSFTKYMRQTVNGCNSPVASVTIQVNQNPLPPTISNPSPICSEGIFPLLVASGTGDSYKWYGTLGPNTPDPNTVYTPITNTADPTDLLVPNTVPNTSSFQRYVSQIKDGCESPVASVDIVVREKPVEPLVDSETYCLNENMNAFNVSTSSGSATVRWFNNADLTGEISPVTDPKNADPVELNLSSDVAGVYTRYTTQTINGCQSNAKTLNVTITPLPSVVIRSSEDLSEICKSDKLILLEASPANPGPGGGWSGNATPGFTNVDLVNGTATLDPSRAVFLPGQTYNLIYTYTDANTACTNSTQQTITILPSVDPSIAIGDACNGLFVNIQNTSLIVPTGATATIASYSWNFDDGDVLVAGSGNIDTETHGGNTQGTYQNLNHRYRAVRQFNIKYSMTTSDGCTVQAQRDINVNPIPNVNFSWSNVCEGNGTQFNATVSNIPNDNNISSFNWNFAKTGHLIVSDEGTGKDPLTTYNNIGIDTVVLTVTSTANCSNIVEKPVFIVPSILPINETHSYTQSFNVESGGWIAGGINSSWAFGAPNGNIINRDSSDNGSGNAWVTNLSGNSNVNERSWVLSPCFDFTQSQKPVISLNIWSDTPRGLDGAVLQYNETGSIEDDASWQVLGTVNAGINWYDQTGISSKPGNQSSVDAGWTGDASGGRYKGWKHAVFKLDNLVGKSNIKFRIAFASAQGSQEGFAFDNIFIGERSRTVLIESFTNSASPNVKLHNDAFNEFAQGEVVKIQYHTSFPGEDPINSLNSSMHNSRTAFYGITESPTIRIDGAYQNGNISSWLNSVYDNRVLVPSPIKINFNTVAKEGEVVRINASIQNITSSTLPFNGVHVFAVVLEKNINDAEWLGPSGNDEFNFVAKDILPTPAGIKIEQALAPGETIMLPEIVWEKQNLIDANEGAIAIFVQSVDRNNREVHQAKLYDNPLVPDFITGNEPSVAARIGIYPNPSDDFLQIVLPERAKHTTPIRMFDSFGREVHQSFFNKGETTKLINTKDFSAGVYIIQLNIAQGMIRKKIMIVHD